MSRVVLPNLFSLSWALSHEMKEGPGVQLRWSLRPDLGLPRNHFVVWVRRNPRFEPIPLALPEPAPISLTGRPRRIEWGSDPMAMVSITVVCDPNETMMLRAYDGPAGSGKLIDEVTTDVSGSLVVFGSVIRSVVVSGSGSVLDAAAIPITTLVSDPDWEPIERVGLPVDGSWDSSVYSMEPQGRVGEETSPIQAALQRLVYGGPESGWPALNDRGEPVPAWHAPFSGQYVDELRRSVLPGLREMLERSSDPSQHVSYRCEKPLPPPLATLMASACSDPFAALGLGFGTYISMQRLAKYIGTPERGSRSLAAQAQSLVGMLMVTVEHELVVDVPSVGKVLREKVTLADINFHPVLEGPPVPSNPHCDRVALDRPLERDAPFRESVRLRWRQALAQVAEDPRARSYAITRAPGVRPHEMLLEPRVSGGHRVFVPAQSTSGPSDPDIQFNDRALTEPWQNPPEPAGVVYSVAAQDWFGRWSSWVSVDLVRTITPPQIPVLLRAELVVLSGTDGALDVEFAWNWTNRSLEAVVFEIKLHAEGEPTPVGMGSILSVGGALVSNPTAVFGGSTMPPLVPEVKILEDDPPSPDFVRYSARLMGLTLDLAKHPRIVASVRLSAFEHIRPGLASGHSRTLEAAVHSPVQSLGMIWSSQPDPLGFARAKLTWTPTPGQRQVVYAADEPALRRELQLPAADPKTPPHQRLVDLRNRKALEIRKAFRRIAEDVTSPFEVELPKGSRAIHFYSVISVNAAQVEAPLPIDTNLYFAVSTPPTARPETPRIATRSRPEGIEVEVILPPGPVATVRVDLHRTSVASNATDLDRMGPPISETSVPNPSAPWRSTTRPDGSVSLRFLDTSAPTNWAPQWYRAVAWSANDETTGTRAARSPTLTPSRNARPATSSPSLDAISTVRLGSHVLVRWSSDLPRDRSPLGPAGFSIKGRSGEEVLCKRAGSEQVLVITGALPTPTEAPDVFMYDDPTDPESATYCAYLELPNPVEIVVAATDPAGRTSTATARHEA